MYEERLLAFVDILGWKKLIADSVADPAMIESLSRAVARLRFQHDATNMQAACGLAKRVSRKDRDASSAAHSASRRRAASIGKVSRDGPIKIPPSAIGDQYGDRAVGPLPLVSEHYRWLL